MTQARSEFPAPLRPERSIGRARRAIAAVAKAVGLATVFVLSCGAAVALHANLRAPREVARARVNALLEGSIPGKLVVHRVATLRLDHIAGVDAEVLGRNGERVLLIEGASADISTFEVLRSLVGGRGTRIRLSRARVDYAEIALEDDETGKLGLVEAFVSDEPSSEPSTLELSIEQASIGHAWVHGHIGPVHVLDADADEVEGRFSTTPESTDLDVAHLALRGRGWPGVNPDGVVRGGARFPSDEGELRAALSYVGRLEGLPIQAGAFVKGEHVAARLHVPRADPSRFQGVLPSIDLVEPVEIDADVGGTLDALAPRVRIDVGSGRVGARAVVVIPPGRPIGIDAHADVVNLDVGAFLGGSPHSRLDATLDASGVVDAEKGALGTLRLASKPGRMEGELVPAIAADVYVAGTAISGRALVAEPGAPTSVSFSLLPDRTSKPSKLAFRTETMVTDLAAVQRVKIPAHGGARVSIDGHIDLDTRALDARAAADVVRLDAGGVAADKATVNAVVSGRLGAPVFEAEVNAANVRTLGFGFPEASASARGSLSNIEVSARVTGNERSPSLSLSAAISRTASAITVRDARAEVARDGVTAIATVDAIAVAGGDVTVSGIRVSGLGDELVGAIHTHGGGVGVRAQAKDLDVSRVMSLLAREEDVRGHIALDVDAFAGASSLTGHVDVEATDGNFDGIDGVRGRVSVNADGRRFAGIVSVAIAGIGHVGMITDGVEVTGSPFDMGAWRKVTGKVELESEFDLAAVHSELAREALPLSEARGRLAVRGEVSRQRGEDLPSFDLEASTNHLALTGKDEHIVGPDGVVIDGPRPWRVEGFDGHANLHFDGTTGIARVSAEVRDPKGPLVSFDAASVESIADLVRHPSKLRERIPDMPIEATIHVPRRSLESLPAFVRVEGIDRVAGEIELDGTLAGTLRAPRFALDAKATALRPSVPQVCGRELDLALHATYDGHAGDVRLQASTGEKQAMDASAALVLDLPRALAGEPFTWEASGDVTFTALPLDLAAVWMAMPIAGDLRGEIHVHDLHRAASADAHLEFDNLSLERATLPSSKIDLALSDGTFSSTVAVEQSDGHLRAKIDGGIRWGAEVVPSIEAAKPLEITLDAKNFRVDAVPKIFPETFSELDGRVDSDARIRIDLAKKDGTMDGAVKIRDGVIEVPGVGERFHAMQGRLIIRPWGTVRLDDFTAEGTTGKLHANALAELDGIRLKTAEANVHIDPGASVPISVEGVPLGRAHGDVTAKATMTPDGKHLDVRVDVPVFGVELPQSTGHSPQSLGNNEHVRIGRYDGTEFVSIPLEKPERPRPPSDMSIHAEIHLGEEVKIAREKNLEVTLRGGAVVDVTDKTRVSGQIELLRGKLEVQGKIFRITRGTVTFQPDDASEPIVHATARWTAPDKTRVFVEFDGTPSAGKLTLHSDPALTEDQIVTLILFGSPDGSFGGSAPAGQERATGAQALGLAGGIVTQGINKAIAGVTSADITTRIDTSQANTAMPEIAVQITKTISASLGYKLGVPMPGESPDRAQLTIDWRFVRNWSVSAAVGEQGSAAVELVWRKRY